jgi:hypothetical protein
MQVVVQIATNLRDPERADDDGTRTLFIKGKHLTEAIRAAVKASRANGLHVGGQLVVQYVADGPVEPGLEKGPKLFAAQYTPPAVSFAGVGAPAAQQQYAPPPQQPAQGQYAPGFAPQPAFAGPAPQQQYTPPAVPVQAPLSAGAAVLGAPAGMDANTWARLDPQQRERVLAAMGVPVPAGQQPGY